MGLPRKPAAIALSSSLADPLAERRRRRSWSTPTGLPSTPPWSTTLPPSSVPNPTPSSPPRLSTTRSIPRPKPLEPCSTPSSSGWSDALMSYRPNPTLPTTSRASIGTRSAAEGTPSSFRGECASSSSLELPSTQREEVLFLSKLLLVVLIAQLSSSPVRLSRSSPPRGSPTFPSHHRDRFRPQVSILGRSLPLDALYRRLHPLGPRLTRRRIAPPSFSPFAPRSSHR